MKNSFSRQYRYYRPTIYRLSHCVHLDWQGSLYAGLDSISSETDTMAPHVHKLSATCSRWVAAMMTVRVLRSGSAENETGEPHWSSCSNATPGQCHVALP